MEELRQALAEMNSAGDATTHILGQEETRLQAVVLMWCWWSARNKANQGERRSTAAELQSTILYHVDEMHKLKSDAGVTNANNNTNQVWQPPVEDT